METSLQSKFHLFSRKSSQSRITTGAFLSSNIYSAYFSSNFALSTSLLHEFSFAQRVKYVWKYSYSALFLSLPYFTINELITAALKTYNIENFFVSYSLSGLIVMPIFAEVQKKFRGFNGKEARFLAYRYVGTICCMSLIGEMFLSIYKNYKLGNFTDSKVTELMNSRKH